MNQHLMDGQLTLLHLLVLGMEWFREVRLTVVEMKIFEAAFRFCLISVQIDREFFVDGFPERNEAPQIDCIENVLE